MSDRAYTLAAMTSHTPQRALAANDAGHEDCPNCGMSIPLPLENFCALCRYPLRVDSFERAARIRGVAPDKIRREGGPQ